MKLHLLSILLVCVSGCVSTRSDEQDYAVTQKNLKPQMTPYEHGRILLDEGRFHAAFLHWPEVMADLIDVAEGALGYEYNMLMMLTSDNGKNDWAAIFMDAAIPARMKQDLLSEIQENAIKGFYE